MIRTSTAHEQPAADKVRPMPSDGLEGFDPYRAWLGVRAIHRPLNAYELLGLDCFEEDEERVREAANLRRIALEMRRYDAPPAIWEQVNRELEQAIGVLLNADRRATYDTALRMERENGRRAGPGGAGAVTGDSHGASIRCPDCGTNAPAMRKFCAECGKPLWEPCYSCGTLCTAAERFCGACGANLSGGFQQRAAQIERDLDQASRLEAEGRYDEAVALLAPIAKTEHARLGEYSRRARERMKQIAAECDLRRQEAAALFDRAQQAAADHDHAAVIRLLESLPAPLRSEAAETLLQQSRAAVAEITRLDEELRRAIAAKDLDGLLVKLERLMLLQPGSPKLVQRAEQIGAQLCQLAERRLAKFQYDDARTLLERVPERLRTPVLSRLLVKAVELSWLHWDLQSAPVVNESLVAGAERMRRLAPDNPRVAKVHAELVRRARLAGANHRAGPVPWAQAPDPTAVGCPVDWATGFRVISIADEVYESLLSEHPGCFFTAAGLAMQGAGAARLKLNLLPTDSGGMLGRVTRIIRSLPSRTAWGIDLSACGLKAVKLTATGDRRQERLSLDACEWLEHKKPLSQTHNENEERSIVEDTLGKFKDRHAIRSGERIAVGLPGHLVLTRSLRFPPMNESQLAKAVEYEARHQLTYPLAQLVWGWHAIDDPEGAAVLEHNLLLAAIRRELVEKRLGWFRSAGLEPDVVQADGVALYNWLVREYLDSATATDGEASGESIALVDMGSDVTNFVVAGRRAVWLRSVPLGAERCTKAIVRQLHTTMSQAEELKRNPAQGERLGEIYQALEPVFDEFLQETRTSLNMAVRDGRGSAVRRLLACGGGFQVHGFFRYLRSGR